MNVCDFLYNYIEEVAALCIEDLWSLFPGYQQVKRLH